MEFPGTGGYKFFNNPCSSQDFQTRNNLLDMITNFKRIPIRDWSYMDTLDWAASVCKKNAIPLNSDVNLTLFQTITGQDLLGFSLQDFTRLWGHVHGRLFFKQFQRLRAKKEKREQEKSVCAINSTCGEGDSVNLPDISELIDTLKSPSRDFDDLESTIQLGDLLYATAGDVCPDDDFRRSEQRFSGTALALTQDPQEPPCSNEPNQWSSSLFPEDLSEAYSSNHSVDQNEWSTYSVDQNQWSTPAAQPVDQGEWPTASCSVDQSDRGNSPSPSVETPESSIFESIPTNTRRGRTRSPKSYEFLLRLLSNPLSNPRLIEWVDRERGVFRLVDKDEIARIWGSREYKGREKQTNLSYDNFARALRYHYSSKTLSPVFEKNFQYQFGPKIMKMINDSEK